MYHCMSLHQWYAQNLVSLSLSLTLSLSLWIFPKQNVQISVESLAAVTCITVCLPFSGMHKIIVLSLSLSLSLGIFPKQNVQISVESLAAVVVDC